MVDYNTTRETKDKKGGEDILAKARKDWDRAMDRERDNIDHAYEDLAFLSGHELSQWPEKQRKDREAEGRPVLQINRLPQFVHQITGDMRQMKPSLKFVPVDNGSDEKVADLYGGLVRYIENRSDAGAVYNRAADSQVACGIGHWRILTEYADDSTFNQEIRIAPIEDGVSVLWDPDSSLPTKEDAKFCFVPVDMSRVAFEEAYPDCTPSDFGDPKWNQNSQWVTDDYVRIAEYWTRKPSKRILAHTVEGGILDLTDEEDPKEAAAIATSMGARVEERDSYKLCRYLISASKVLETVEWPGRLIPIVPVIGEETRIGRKIIRNGIVRHAKDPQQMLNYFHSAHTEVVALQPKAPFMLTETNVAKYQAMWENANSQNLPYLVYEPDTKNSGASPQRVQPPVSSQGVLDGLAMAAEDLKAVIGIYDASLGNKSNETSGKAILARQREGDVGSFLYMDNFTRSIRRTGQILVDLIPHVYDTERSIRIMGEDGKVDIIDINKAQGLGQDGKIINDVTTGSYDVVATVGPSFSTRREEAREGMIEFIRAAPEVAPLILDKIAKAQDWPMADDIAKRLRATLPPHILAMEEAEEQGADPEQARQQAMAQNQPPPDPAVLKIQADKEQEAARLQADQQKTAIDGEQKQQDMVLKAQIEREKIAEQARQAEADRQANIEIEREKIASQERIAMFNAKLAAETAEQDFQRNQVAERERREFEARDGQEQHNRALQMKGVERQFQVEDKAAEKTEKKAEQKPEIDLEPVMTVLKKLDSRLDAVEKKIDTKPKMTRILRDGDGKLEGLVQS